MPEWLFIDFDGTLVDSHPLLYETYAAMMQQQGLKPTKEEFEELIGPSLPEVIETLRWKYKWEISAETLLDQYMRLLRQRYPQEAPFFPDVKETLQYAKKKKVKMAIVTSAPAVVVQKFLMDHELEGLFAHIVDPAGLKAGKPDPAIYLRALEVVGADADNVLAIEDSGAGVKAALAAEIPVIQIVHQQKVVGHDEVPQVPGWPGVITYLEGL